MNCFISVSDIATVVDQNPYQDSDECLKKYKKRFFPSQNPQELREEKVRQEVTKQLQSQGVDLKTYLKKIKVNNSNQVCDQLNDALPATLPPSYDEAVGDSPAAPGSTPAVTADEIKKYVRSAVYKAHGKKFENKVFEWLKTQLHGELAESQKGKGANLGIIDKIPWRVYGKIDGMFTNKLGKKFIIEIKNRQNRLFDQIPFYEQIQVQMYMCIFKVQNAVLVQHYADTHSLVYFKYDPEFVARIIKDLKAAIARMKLL